MISDLGTEYEDEAKAILIEHNLRLVVYIAKKFDNTGVGVEDLISIGTIGLIKSINTFNPEKNIKLLQGGCPTHVRMSKRDVEKAQKAHPDALLLVHPECLPEVSELADYRGSTTGIMDYAKKSDAKEFIIGTENSIVQHLQFACPDKQFYPLSRDCVCHNMKLTTLGDVYQCVKGTGGEEIKLDEEVRIKAKRCIDTMLELGN